MFSRPLSPDEDSSAGPARRKTGGADPAILSLFEDLLKDGSDLRVKVTGRSMVPFLHGGEVLTLRRVDSASLRRGDLIFFRGRDGNPILHRIIHILRKEGRITAFQTKGDALYAFDEPVLCDDVLAKVCTIENGAKSIDLETGAWSRRNGFIAMMSLFKTRLAITLHALRNLV